MTRFNISHIKVPHCIDANHHQKSSPANWFATSITTQIIIFIIQWYLLSSEATGFARSPDLTNISWQTKVTALVVEHAVVQPISILWGTTGSYGWGSHLTTSGRGDCLETTMAVLQEVCIAAANASVKSELESVFHWKNIKLTALILPTVFGTSIIYKLAPLVVACITNWPFWLDIYNLITQP